MLSSGHPARDRALRVGAVEGNVSSFRLTGVEARSISRQPLSPSTPAYDICRIDAAG